MDCSLPGSSVHGVLQVRILEWVAILTQGSNPGLLHCRQIPYLGSPNLPGDLHNYPYYLLFSFLKYLFICLFIYLAVLSLSSLTKDGVRAPPWRVQSLSHRTGRKVPVRCFKYHLCTDRPASSWILQDS